MRFHSRVVDSDLHADLKEALEKYRLLRNFDASEYIQRKSEMLNAYMQAQRLSACVIALSGGIDSAVVLGIVSRASEMPDSPIKRVDALILPAAHSDGATGQNSSASRAIALCHFWGVNAHRIDLSDLIGLAKASVDKSFEITGETWAEGQLVSYIRTPVIYYATSLLNQRGFAPVVCGTTNRDEGAYLGYFGKASDGMVDVQVISDIHKSEVYLVGAELGVTTEIMNVEPSGDMFDGRLDEQVFGAPYDFVEFYLHFLGYTTHEKREFLIDLSKEANDQFFNLARNLEQLHSFNGHKYLAHSPAVHLDVMPASVPGGWQFGVWNGLTR